MSDPLKIIGYFVFAIYIICSFWLFLNAMVQLHLLWHYKKNKKRAKVAARSLAEWPFITIQVPVYNEKFVIERLLQSLAQLDYPTSRFEIQVLDDSTDETSSIIDRAITAIHERGIEAYVVRRANRKEYKAGALQHGLPYCKGELIAIFDADFMPSTDFLKRMVPHFSNPRVGLVQARWGHINKDENALTCIQTFLLDTHFSIEQTGRSNAGYFINFCGTAGIWRKQCIEDAGGWDGTVLSEDLDISYRAQLKGWQMVYDGDTEVPAEVPAVMEAFKIQQFRWTKGMAQIFRKNLKALLHSEASFSKKLHGFFHLLSSFVFVCLFINAILTVPLLLFRNWYPEFISLTQYTLFSSINLIALTLFFYNGTQSASHANKKNFFIHYPLFLVIYMALSVQNAIAVMQGLLGKSSVFVRTPKFNTHISTHNGYLDRKLSAITLLELVVLCYFFYGIGLSFYLHDYFMLLFFIMIVSGLCVILYQTLMIIFSKPILERV